MALFEIAPNALWSVHTEEKICQISLIFFLANYPVVVHMQFTGIGGFFCARVYVVLVWNL